MVDSIPVPFNIFMLFANLWFIRLQEYFSILRKISTMTFTRSSALRESRWHLIEGKFLSWDSFGPSYVGRL